MGQHKRGGDFIFNLLPFFHFYGPLCVCVSVFTILQRNKKWNEYLTETPLSFTYAVVHCRRQIHMQDCQTNNARLFLQILWMCIHFASSECDRNAHTAILDCWCNNQQAVILKKANTLSVCLPHQMPYQLVRKVLARAKTFSSKFHHLSPKQSVDTKQNANQPEIQYVYST